MLVKFVPNVRLNLGGYMIKFKNGSKIESVYCTEGRTGRSKVVYYIGKPTLRDKWLDFVLKIKSHFKSL